MKRSVIFCLMLLLGFLAEAQTPETYKTVVCEGLVPADVRIPSSIKSASEIKKLENEQVSRKERRDLESFYLGSNFALDELLRSGLILFNDPITQYLEEVLDVLLEGNPELRKTIKVYTLRSSSVNAFATNRGEVFVNMGLLAQLETEAQLALILAHEIAHVEHGHSLDLFLESKRIERSDKRSKILSQSVFDEDKIAVNNYSKEMEKEADAEGLEILLQSNYSVKSLDGVYDVLKYAYLPFDEVLFPTDFFNSEQYVIPEAYWLEQVNAIDGGDEFEDNPKSTHPSIGQRRAYINEQIKTIDNEGRSEFLLPKERFLEIQRVARFEIAMLQLRHDNAAEAIYSGFLIKNLYPNDELYHRKIVGKGLYTVAKIRNNNGNFDFEPDFLRKFEIDGIEGQSQQVYHLLRSMPAQELVVLALRYNWKTLEQFPNDAETDILVKDLFIELARKQTSLSNFYDAITKEEIQEISKDEVIEDEPQSKYDKIRNEKKRTIQYGEQEYWRLGFAEFLQQPKFKSYFEEGQETYKNREAWTEAREAEDKDPTFRNKKRKKLRRQGLALDVAKVVVVDPTYVYLRGNKGKATYRHISTEKKQREYSAYFEEIGSSMPLEVEVIDANTFRQDDLDAYNDFRFLSDWFRDQLIFEDVSITPGYEQEEVNRIADKYNTDYFLWSGTVVVAERNSVTTGLVLSVILYPLAPLIPLLGYQAINYSHNVFTYAILFNVRTGSVRTIKYDYYKAPNDAPGFLKTQIYDVLNQIHQAPK